MDNPTIRHVSRKDGVPERSISGANRTRSSIVLMAVGLTVHFSAFAKAFDYAQTVKRC